MNRHPFKIYGAALLPSVATMLFVQACGGGSAAIAQQAGDPYEGVWDAVVTARDCSTNAVVGTFRGSQVIHRGGTLSDTNASPPATRGPGFGVWSRNGDGTYAVRFRYYRYNADGSLAGTAVVTSKRTLSADGNAYTGETRGEARDPSGVVIGQSCVVDVGTRFG
jgi:hypothetical protein